MQFYFNELMVLIFDVVVVKMLCVELLEFRLLSRQWMMWQSFHFLWLFYVSVIFLISVNSCTGDANDPDTATLLVDGVITTSSLTDKTWHLTIT